MKLLVELHNADDTPSIFDIVNVELPEYSKIPIALLLESLAKKAWNDKFIKEHKLKEHKLNEHNIQNFNSGTHPEYKKYLIVLGEYDKIKEYVFKVENINNYIPT